MVPIAIGIGDKKGAKIGKRLFHMNYNYKFKHALKLTYTWMECRFFIFFGNKKGAFSTICVGFSYI